MRRGPWPAAGPASICGVDLEPTAVVDFGLGAAVGRQVFCNGYVRPRPGRGMPGKKRPTWPLSNAACSALMRAMSTDMANPKNL